MSHLVCICQLWQFEGPKLKRAISGLNQKKGFQILKIPSVLDLYLLEIPLKGGGTWIFFGRKLDQNFAQFRHENYSDFQILSLWDLPLA